MIQSSSGVCNIATAVEHHSINYVVKIPILHVMRVMNTALNNFKSELHVFLYYHD